jgi:DNA-binding LacI/PurR family transcriptional regulator
MNGKQIGVAAQSFTSVFSTHMLIHLRRYLQEGETIVTCWTVSMTDRAEVKTRLEKFLASVKPFALIGVSVRPDVSTVAAYRAADVSVVLVDEEAPGASTVAIDNFKGGYLAGDYLAKKGRRNIAVVCGKLDAIGSYNAIHRLAGLKKALAANDLAFSDQALIEVENYYAGGTDAMTRLLAKNIEVDGIFSAAGDMCASGLVQTAQKRGLQVPKDIAIVGFDDLDIAKSIIPPLTTIRQPMAQMAAMAYQLAVTEREQTLKKPRKVVFEPELVVRSSA